MKRILVTGSAGLIGGRLAQEIERRDPDAFVQRVDILSGHDCRRFFANQDSVAEWDLAVHCAAITGGIEGTVNNSAYQGALNAQLDGAYLEWALRTRPGHIVYISSSCAYPPTKSVFGLPSGENDIDFLNPNHDPDNVYGWVKLTGEVMANAVRDRGVGVSVVRPFAIYGERQEDCRMIPAFIKRALSDSNTMEVWGPGNQASDFCHVDDCVNALLEIVDQNIDGPVNIGTGRGATADEVAKMVMREVGVKKEIVHNMDKPYGPRWRVADPTLLHTIYKPTVSLEEGVRRVVHAQAGIPTSYGPGDDLA